MVQILVAFFLFSCSLKHFYYKWDYETQKWYEEKKSEEKEFKVILKNKECFYELKRKFRVKSDMPSTIIIVRLSREELTEMSKDNCVVYVEFPRSINVK